jgi:hypothetical protein
MEHLASFTRPIRVTRHSIISVDLGLSCLSEDTKAGVAVWNIAGQEDVLDVGSSTFAHLNG